VRVFVKICSFWACFFGFATLIFYLIFLLIFRFVEFFSQRILAFFSVKLPISACFSNLLACFWKITWHHWFRPLGRRGVKDVRKE